MAEKVPRMWRLALRLTIRQITNEIHWLIQGAKECYIFIRSEKLLLCCALSAKEKQK